MQLCDSHCHLESSRFDSDRQEVITRARQAGVGMLISCGSNVETSRQQIELAGLYTGIYAAVGIHGQQAQSAVLRADEDSVLCDEDILREIARLAASAGVVALGELGLDYHYEFSPRRTQQVVLERQLELAVSLKLPVILHNRESDQDLMRIVDPYPVRSVLHCFLGGPELLDWALERGFYIGVAGPVTFPHMEHLHRMLQRVPHDRLLVETDSPYLAPQRMRGQRNEPANIVYIADQVARILGMPVEQIAEITYANSLACFGVHDAA